MKPPLGLVLNQLYKDTMLQYLHVFISHLSTSYPLLDGQTGTGKTFTMEGFNSENTSVEARGIIPRAIEQIFGHIQRNISPRMRFLVRASYLQIYNEQVRF